MWKEPNQYTYVYGSLDINYPSVVEGSIYINAYYIIIYRSVIVQEGKADVYYIKNKGNAYNYFKKINIFPVLEKQLGAADQDRLSIVTSI